MRHELSLIAHCKRTALAVVLMVMAVVFLARAGQDAASDKRAQAGATGVVAALARHDLGEVNYRFDGALADKDYERLKSEVPKGAGIDPTMYTASIVKRLGKDRVLLRIVQNRASPSPKFSASVEMTWDPVQAEERAGDSAKDAWVVTSVRFQQQ